MKRYTEEQLKYHSFIKNYLGKAPGNNLKSFYSLIMPIFALNDEIIFPPVELAEDNGILAVGGDLSPERLIESYSCGIFPWYSEGDPIIWWSPDPRFVLLPKEIKISKSMRQVLKKIFLKLLMMSVLGM